MEKIKLNAPVIVEGKYDKITLSSILDADILTLGGFSVFHESERKDLLRRVAEKNGVIVLTDSDGAGKVLRGYLSSILPKEKVTHLYVPRIEGKEKRKKTASKEGTLGVEGMDADLLRNLFLPFAADAPEKQKSGEPLTKADLFSLGLSGGENAKERRELLAKRCGLPRDMSSNALLAALNLLYSKEEILKTIEEI